MVAARDFLGFYGLSIWASLNLLNVLTAPTPWQQQQEQQQWPWPRHGTTEISVTISTAPLWCRFSLSVTPSPLHVCLRAVLENGALAAIAKWTVARKNNNNNTGKHKLTDTRTRTVARTHYTVRLFS